MTARSLRIISAGGALAATLACGGPNFNFGPTPFSAVFLVPASPTVQIGDTVTMIATPEDQSGLPIPAMYTATFSSSDTTKVTVGPATGVVTGVAVGSATITGTIALGALTHSGTQMVSVTAPSSPTDVIASASLAFVPPQVTISAGSTVRWHFESVMHTVTFDNLPAGATGPAGIGATSNAVVARTFPTRGVYPYHCSIHSSMTGTVTVN